MAVRVDLERLRELSRRALALESEARRLRRENGDLLLKVQELRNTIEGLSYHMEFKVDLTPTGRDVDATVPRIKTSPIRTDRDIEKALDSWPCEETPRAPECAQRALEAQLPRSKVHWTPKKGVRG